MKKFVYTAMTVLAVLSLAACQGGKKEAAETTAQAATEDNSGIGVDGDSSVAGPVDISNMQSFQATVQKLDGKNLTVEYVDGTSLTLDTTDAFVNPAWELMPGDEVEIFYNGDEGSDIPADGAKVAEVVMSVPYEYVSDDFSAEPQVYGEITKLSDDSITIREDEGINTDDGPQDGVEYTFKIPSYATTIGKAKVGTYAQVLYLGKLSSDDAKAYRICTDDKLEGDESEVFEIKGTLAQFKDGIIYLKTDEGEVFCFTIDGDEKLAKVAADSIDKKVKISYTDSIRMRVSTCDGIKFVK
ncbi:hypothetical protein SAMN05216349_1105 [Oribacterium sp. KHPX15]|uniref:hypothetical protein n=1 Tax=Oribacterium sp. KHPX15 TaxID=1855342 RepID=UPI0008981F20|nr:hypothetical protein [Oribacterium sp. KHPX15]SEA34761.1 hypothetical protein SAMN05216349_1105 [Oribacterium sp. KHPX15]